MTDEGSPPVGDAELLAVLTRSAELGHIGGSDLAAHVRHAQAFASALGRVPTRVLDLGSGGGLPGLVLAQVWSDANLTLLDGSSTRAAFLAEAIEELGIAPRVSVSPIRAEVAGRDPALRATFDLVVARSFGAPAVLAECAAPFLSIGGELVVSEPPDGVRRWDHPEELAELGLIAEDRLRVESAGTFQVLRLTGLCPERYPRRTGIPAKRPLFR